MGQIREVKNAAMEAIATVDMGARGGDKIGSLTDFY